MYGRNLDITESRIVKSFGHQGWRKKFAGKPQRSHREVAGYGFATPFLHNNFRRLHCVHEVTSKPRPALLTVVI
ncbi:MAG TPA: hypothetical protein DDZ51_02480 [Planctomycetaceae bacterium]|nr:hypothetical protein [Planctomycetaceae bacterium]